MKPFPDTEIDLENLSAEDAKSLQDYYENEFKYLFELFTYNISSCIHNADSYALLYLNEKVNQYCRRAFDIIAETIDEMEADENVNIPEDTFSVPGQVGTA